MGCSKSVETANNAITPTMNVDEVIDFDKKPLDHDDPDPNKKDSEKTTSSAMVLLEQ